MRWRILSFLFSYQRWKFISLNIEKGTKSGKNATSSFIPNDAGKKIGNCEFLFSVSASQFSHIFIVSLFASMICICERHRIGGKYQANRMTVIWKLMHDMLKWVFFCHKVHIQRNSMESFSVESIFLSFSCWRPAANVITRAFRWASAIHADNTFEYNRLLASSDSHALSFSYSSNW